MSHDEKNKINFGQLMSGVAEVYGKKISPVLLNIYWIALEKYSFNEIKKAVQQHLLNTEIGQFMPKPADFVRAIEGKNDEKILMAWQKLIQAIKLYGAYQSVIFDDPIIHVVVEHMGGWIVCCHLQESKLSFAYQEFSRYYRIYLSAIPIQYPKQLTGITEHQNRLYGHAVEKPIILDNLSENLFLSNEGNKHEKIKCIKKIKENEKNESDTGN